MNGYGRILLAQHLMAAGHSLDYADGAIARDELDVLDWAASAAESVMFDSPRDRGDDYGQGWMDGVAATEERLLVEAERARLEAAAADITVPPQSPSLRPELAERAAARVAERQGSLARALTPRPARLPARPEGPFVEDECRQPLDEEGEPVRLDVHHVDGQLLIPAEQVTAMVRGIAHLWRHQRGGGAPLDLDTTARLCQSLEDYADSLDAELAAADLSNRTP
ncbi:hypothetical protein [Streptomyces sp. NRRL S-350]|uniref:hypothetical protein n=1 Tax=Streptomyces sp. NRRL S-350 TaxID=1463902 RepID=UPI0004BF6790|nr:hypothetical protein [Streptomyces sp. NRRL S-350]